MKRSTCSTAVLAAAAIAAGVTSTTAAGADARRAVLPPAVSNVGKIRAIYPALYRAEVARTPTSWARLRRAARSEWMRTHRCSDATLARLYALGARSSWETVEATWECDRVPAGTRSFLRCIATKEGGTGSPTVWYTEPAARAAMGGNYDGWLGGRFVGTDRVVGHVQVRPYHARKVAPEVAGRDLLVTRETFEIITHPVNHARIAVRVGAGAYATRGACSG